MESKNWVYNFDPDFPIHIFPFMVVGNRDSLHWHDYVEIGLCTSGEGYFIYMNKSYTVNQGDIFISNNNESHVAVTDEGNESNYIFLILLPEFIAHPHGREFDLNYISFFNYSPLNFVNKIDGGSETAKTVGCLMQELLAVYSSDAPLKKMKIDILVRQILMELSSHYQSISENDLSEDVPIHPKIHQAINFINNHYTESISAQSVSDYLQIDQSYFRHLFKNETRITFKTYVTHLRLSKARSLLLSTDMNISEIISEVGFSNASQFYKTFTTFSRMTPAEFRKFYRYPT